VIFTYPAIITKNVDRRYLPAAIKSIELQFLHNIAESVSSGVLRFKIVQKYPGGPYSELKLESINQLEKIESNILFEQNFPTPFSGGGAPQRPRSTGDFLEVRTVPLIPKINVDFLDEKNLDVIELSKQVDSSISSLYKYYSKINDPDLIDDIKVQEDQYHLYYDYNDKPYKLDSDGKPINIKTGDVSSNYPKLVQGHIEFLKWRESHDNVSKQLQDLIKTKNMLTPLIAKSKSEYTGGANVKIDTTTFMDLRPTAISIEADIQVSKWKGKNILRQHEMEKQRMIPLSVKVVPIFINSFKDISSILLDDMYTNEFSRIYRSFVRTSSGSLFRIFKPILHKLYDAVMPGDINVWRDIILTRKGLVDASSFSGKLGHGKYKKDAASIIIMSVNDIRRSEKDFFSNSKKVSRLFSMGWNSFAVMDDIAKSMTFCCEYDNGLCNVIPYNYMFKSLAASDLYKELDDLGKFTTRMSRGLKNPSSVFGHLKESVINKKIEKVPKGYKEEAKNRVNKILCRYKEN